MLGESCPTLCMGYHDHSSKTQTGDKEQKMFSMVSLGFLSHIPEKASNVPMHRDKPITECWEVLPLCSWRTSFTACGHCLPFKHCGCWRRVIGRQSNTQCPASQVDTGLIVDSFVYAWKEKAKEALAIKWKDPSPLNNAAVALSGFLSSPPCTSASSRRRGSECVWCVSDDITLLLQPW